MSGGLFIRGFAAPYEALGLVPLDGGGVEYETIAVGAIDLAGSGPVDIRCDHDGAPFASTSDGSLVLGHNEFGVTYEAAVPDRCAIWGWLPSIKALQLGASVQIVDMVEGQDRRPSTLDDLPCQRVVRARIEHVALTHRPTYADTSAWFAHWDPDEFPPAMRAEAARWAAPKLQSPPLICNRGGPRRRSLPPATRTMIDWIADRALAGHAPAGVGR